MARRSAQGGQEEGRQGPRRRRPLEGRLVAPLRTERLDLVALDPAALTLAARDDVAGLAQLLGAAVPPGWCTTVPAALRLVQLAGAPADEPWLVRAIVLRDEARVVGHVGFHARPDEHGLVEVGYEIGPADRRRGIAREAVLGLTAWAAHHGATVCVASVAPANAASLALVRSLGFVRSGHRIDPLDGLEHRFACPLPLPARGRVRA